jgi:hypothetical protein
LLVFCLFVCFFVCLFVFLIVCLFDCLFVFFFVCLFLNFVSTQHTPGKGTTATAAAAAAATAGAADAPGTATHVAPGDISDVLHRGPYRGGAVTASSHRRHASAPSDAAQQLYAAGKGATAAATT